MSDFKTCLVKDSTIADITPEITYAVMSGASSTTYQPFPASSSSASTLLFSIQVPSENIVTDRAPLIKTDLEFQLRIQSVPIGSKCIDYGYKDSLMPFPLASLMNTATAQINNSSVSVNVKDVLPALSRMTDSRHLQKYNGTTPTLPDQFYYNYGDAIASNANPMSAFNNMSYDSCLMPRGSHPVTMEVFRYVPGQADYVDTSPISTALTDTFIVKVRVSVAEPVLVSPFSWCDPEFNAQGLVGIKGMNFTFSIDSTLSRLWSSANLQGSDAQANYYTELKPGYEGGGKLFNNNPSMLFKFLTTQASDNIQTKNVVPYMDFPIHVTSANNNASMQPGASQTLISSNLQLNQLPDKFLIFVRKPMSQQVVGDSNSFMKVNSITVNLNNQSGLLSTAQPEDLWRMSSKNGVSQSWREFSGQAYDNNANGQGVGGNLATTGSLLCICPAYDLSLPDFLSGGCLGQYNLSISINVTNQSGVAMPVEVCIIQINSGYFVTQSGQSSTYTGILTREAVLAAKSTQSVGSSEVTRLVGGGRLNASIGRIAKGAMHGAKKQAVDELEGGAMGQHYSGGGGGLSGLY